MDKRTEDMYTRLEQVKAIKQACEDYIGYVCSINNECAYTDRIIEKIKHTASEIKEF